MNTKQLEYFLATVSQGSIASAARKLDVAQPAISQQLANLEKLMGTELLKRSYSGVFVTEAGKVFTDHARTILNEINHAKINIKSLSSNTNTTIRIAMMPSINNALTIPLIEALESNYPHIHLDISTGPSYSIAGWLQHDKVDLALGFEQSFSAHNMNAIPIIEEHMYLIVSTTPTSDKFRALLDLDTIPFWQLTEHQLLIPNDRDALGQFIRKCESQVGAKLRHDSTYSGQLMTGLRQVMMGKGLTILPSSAAYHLEESNRVKLIKIVQPDLRRRVLAITNKATPTNHATYCIINEVKRIASDLNKAKIWRGQLC